MASVQRLRDADGGSGDGSRVGVSQATRDLYDRLVRAVRRRSRDQDPWDVVHDAYARLSVARARSEVRDQAAFLHVAVFNLIRDRARAATTRAAWSGTVADVEAVAADAPPVDRVLDGKRRLALLEQALAELPPKVRAALVMYRFDDMPQARIAEELGLSVSMVEKHIRRALQHCRRRLAEADRDA